MRSRSGVVFASILVIVVVAMGSSAAFLAPRTAAGPPWTVVKEGISLDGQPATVPCAGLDQLGCEPASSATLSPVALVAYGSGRYYVYNETSKYGTYNGTVLYINYSIWFTNETVYCVTPAYLVGNVNVMYPTCPVSPFSSYTYHIPSSGASAYDPGLGLSLNLSLSEAPGGGVQVTASEFNLRAQNDTVLPASAWKVPPGNLTSQGCGGVIPVGFAVYAGDYGPADASRGHTLRLSAGSTLFCPYVPSVSRYVFKSASDVALAVDSIGSIATAMSSTLTVSGRWVGGDPYTFGGPCPPAAVYPSCPPLVFDHLSPGVYTVVAADEWGQVAILHFTVTAA